MKYELRATEVFEDKYNSLRNEKDRINKLIVELEKNPYHNTKRLTGILVGKRSRRIGKIRIIFMICEECRKLNHQEKNGGDDCSNCKDKTVRLYDVGKREDIYT